MMAKVEIKLPYEGPLSSGPLGGNRLVFGPMSADWWLTAYPLVARKERGEAIELWTIVLPAH